MQRALGWRLAAVRALWAGILFAATCGAVVQVTGQTRRPPNTYHAVLTQNSAPADVVEVHPDRTVTFHLRAPDAARVAVRIEVEPPRPLVKAADGLWSVTVGPLPSAVYPYFFEVDGVAVADTSNPRVAVGRAIHWSLLEIPSSPPRLEDRQDVPHGVVQVREYRSSVLKAPRRLVVYVPPQYDANPSQRFPVLYLRHGNGGMEGDWSSIGRADVILDNLMAQRKAVPMLVVMPNGYPGDGPGSTPEGIDAIGNELLTDIVPFVERSYRVAADADHRALAGLSMGANQAFVTGLRHPEAFAWIGAFSSGVIGDADFKLASTVPGLLEQPEATNKRLRLLFLSCGSEDPRFIGHLDVVDLLKQHNIRHDWFSTPGVHEWTVWRRSLAEFLPKLFQKN